MGQGVRWAEGMDGKGAGAMGPREAKVKGRNGARGIEASDKKRRLMRKEEGVRGPKPTTSVLVCLSLRWSSSFDRHIPRIPN